MDVDIAPAPQQVAPSMAAATTQLTPSKKRNHDGEVVTHSPLPQIQQDCQSSPLTVQSGSPQFSDHSTPLTELGITPPVSPAIVKSQTVDMAPKKLKLTVFEKMEQKKIKEAEKAAKEAEKAEKEKVKAEAKAKKEEEKQRKEEEKKRKDEEKELAKREREEKKAIKDAEKQVKEAEKQRLQAEADKKEAVRLPTGHCYLPANNLQAQSRIRSFFGRPAAASTPPLFDQQNDVSRGTTPTRRNSITSIDMEDAIDDVEPASKPVNREYRRFILPFFVGDNTEMAPTNRFHQNRAFYDDRLPLNEEIAPEKLGERFLRHRRARPAKAVKQIMSDLSTSMETIIDLTDSTTPLAGIPYKYLFYKEDVRPAYQGTYSRPVSPRKARKLAIDPTYRGLPATDYDYDSEAEWQEPEEGDEEVLDDDEQSEDEAGDEEMDDFLDDENDLLKRQQLDEKMQPVSSGICWEGVQPQNEWNFDVLRIQPMHDSVTFPIDPLSAAHWADVKKPVKEKSPQPATMQPPRLPLMTVDPNTGSLTPPKLLDVATLSTQNENAATSAKKVKASTSGKPVKFVPPDVLPSFKAAVQGSALTKVGLIEVLKTKFSTCSKDMIKHTLEAIAKREGPKRGEEKWVLLTSA
jgi:chromatin assembly factor 1 subunit A